jgi:hypothetical protein
LYAVFEEQRKCISVNNTTWPSGKTGYSVMNYELLMMKKCGRRALKGGGNAGIAALYRQGVFLSNAK